MPKTFTARVFVAPKILLDGRLALFHETQGWLAVADLHFGYELSQRAAGRLIPLWGMDSIEARLTELLDEYHPRYLIIVGDLVHDRTSTTAAMELLARLRRRCEVVTVEGNHDRYAAKEIQFTARWETAEFVFQHDDCQIDNPGRIQIIGHHHPAATIRDGAGLRLKLPAFVQNERRWILPAFSPWAGGVEWHSEGEARIWLCTPQRVLLL
jgi:uncharacterized protein